MPLQLDVSLGVNPYSETIPDDALAMLLASAGRARATDIEARHRSGDYERDRMSLVILDPTAPPARPADDMVVALLSIGAEGDFFAPNAMAKAFCQREHGADGTVVVVGQNHRVADSSFRFGGAVDIDGTIVGASGQTPLQDRFQATLLAADFNYAIAYARSRWENEHGPGRWYLDEQSPPQRFTDIIGAMSRT